MLKIINGEVYDPINGVHGISKTICIRNGKIVEEVPNTAQIIDASNLVVMPGGIDIHSHISGLKVNVGRGLRPEDHRKMVIPKTKVTRSGVGYTLPSTFATGYLYTKMGYTTVMEAAVPPLGARHTHEEFNDTPMIDKGCYILMGNNEFILRYLQKGEYEKARDYVAWLLNATKGYGIKVVNPGGIENWKYGKDVDGLDDKVDYFDITPRQILTGLAQINQDLHLPHPLHIHCNNLGTPGNYQVTLQTMHALERKRVHLTHVQFHSYGGEDWNGFCTKASEIAEYLNQHPQITIDVGQIIFGDTTTMTADGPWQYRLHKISGKKWYNSDVEQESGCGIVPYVYKEKNYVNAIQWAIGLELFLLVKNPWQVFMSTDHPNGGPFIFYPYIIRLLMDKKFRNEMIKRVHKKVLNNMVLPHITREYSLNEIAIITRAGPTKALGLTRKGHLGVGADGDIVLYPKREDKEEMFENPIYVIKDGEVVLREGEILKNWTGKSLFVSVPENEAFRNEIRDEFEKYYTMEFSNYPTQLETFARYEIIRV
jgi:formylmethanofuran dehydrogenase subunit A